MAENENVAVEQVEESVVKQEEVVTVQQTPPTEKNKPSFGAKIKEWGRKKVVNLKRKPQSIALFFLLVSSIIYLMALNSTSFVAFKTFPAVDWLGMCVFVTTLFSILVLVLFLNTFPKYPKVSKKSGKRHYINYVMMALVFIFIAVMIFFDMFYYSILLENIPRHESWFFKTIEEATKYQSYWGDTFASNPVIIADDYVPQITQSMAIMITHVVFLGISAILLATRPLYKKLILKINTKKEVEDNNIKEVIDTED